jgi:hypothetical protein
LSGKHQAKCVEEWISTCKKHSENPVAVGKYFEPILVDAVLASLEMKNFGDWFKYLWIYPNPIVHKLAKNIVSIDSQYMQLRIELEKRGVKVANLSSISALEAWPKMDLETFNKL